MADHGQVDYATATGNDLAAHESNYKSFVHLTYIGACHVANFLIGLAIGGVAGNWWVAFGIFVVATLVALHGLATGAKAPSGVMVALSLVALALTAGG
jgi:hypothetical protein